MRAQAIPAGLLVLSGILAGVAWRLLVPLFLDHSDRQEASFAVEGCLAAVCALAGLVTGMMVIFKPGASAAVRTTVAIAGSIAGAALAWLTGEVLGAPVLTSTGIILIWPVITSIVIFTGSMLPLVSDRLNSS